MTAIETPFYSLQINSIGLLSLTAKHGTKRTEVMDRGALHETLDVARWGEYTNADILRKHDHHIQLYRDADITVKEGYVCITGELATATQRAGILAFETHLTWRKDSPYITLKTRRQYLKSCVVGDDSLCFLTPRNVAQQFCLHTNPAVYQAREDKTPWRDFQKAATDLYASTTVPRRLKAVIPTTGWGAILGTHGGFVVILMKYAPGTAGEMRCTRPRSGAFDELEFQWAPGGSREKGLIETGHFLLAPCLSGTEANALFTNPDK
jgi:hypothetical protein